MNVQRLTLDLDKSSVPRGRVTIAQCDHDGTTVEAEIYDNGIALSTSGLSAYLVMRLPDGRHYYRVPATLDGHVATALVDEAYAATATGTTEIAYFELVGSGGVVYSTSRFGVRVLPSATADATVPETWDGEVERLIQQLDEMAEDSREIIDDLTTLEETVGAAEQGRVSAESGRVSAETARANAETARANAESGRVSAESGRVSAEQGRVTAEQGRVSAESSRVSEFATLKSESQAATSAANSAAGNANTAANAANTAANVANAAAANADATADGVESRVQEMAQDAAETATADAEQRIQDAIDAMGDISELAVPLMSKDVRGGAKLEEHGGLVLRDEKLGIGSLVQESDGYARGGLAEVTAEGHAEQFTTSGKNLLPDVFVANNHTTLTKNGPSDYTYVATTADSDGSMKNNTSDTEIGGLYTLSFTAKASSSTGFHAEFHGGYGNTVVIETSWSRYSMTVQKTQSINNLYMWSTISNITVNIKDLQLELGSTATSYEPYTGGAPSPSPDYPQDIQVVRGRNLLDPSKHHQLPRVTEGATFSDNGDGGIALSGTPTGLASMEWSGIEVGEGKHTLSLTGSSTNVALQLFLYDGSGTQLLNTGNVTSYTFDTASYPTAKTAKVALKRVSDNVAITGVAYVQLEQGSVATPYVPYGHVGMEARDPDTDELISCTALPLPSRGWVAGLPDGTADTLTLDGAGKVEWEETVTEEVWDGSENWYLGDGDRRFLFTDTDHVPREEKASTEIFSHFIYTYSNASPFGTARINTRGYRIIPDANSAMASVSDFKTWLQSHPVTVLYPLATPVTEDCGYIDDWPTDIPEGAVIDIPELSEVGIKYFIDSSVTELAKQWYARAQSEYETRLSTLESIVAELV